MQAQEVLYPEGLGIKPRTVLTTTELYCAAPATTNR